MKRIAILNGPNLNLLGTREPGVYGHQTLEDLEASWVAFGQAHGVEVICFQSNVEGELIDAIQRARLIAQRSNIHWVIVHRPTRNYWCLLGKHPASRV